jgi:hypothetical protein
MNMPRLKQSSQQKSFAEFFLEDCSVDEPRSYEQHEGTPPHHKYVLEDEESDTHRQLIRMIESRNDRITHLEQQLAKADLDSRQLREQLEIQKQRFNELKSITEL